MREIVVFAGASHPALAAEILLEKHLKVGVRTNRAT